jgi:hypothetical protein
VFHHYKDSLIFRPKKLNRGRWLTLATVLPLFDKGDVLELDIEVLNHFRQDDWANNIHA